MTAEVSIVKIQSLTEPTPTGEIHPLVSVFGGEVEEYADRTGDRYLVRTDCQLWSGVCEASGILCRGDRCNLPYRLALTDHVIFNPAFHLICGKATVNLEEMTPVPSDGVLNQISGEF